MSKTVPFETNARRLEQFLFAHDIQFDAWYRDRDGMTVWRYNLDDEGLRVLEEYRRIIARRKERERQEGI